MIYGILFWEFFKIGLMAVGGGLVTIPFLLELADKYHWFSHADLMNMIAVSESTPGPIGINMATYVGYTTVGWWGGIVATAGLVLPALMIIIFIAKYLFNESENSWLRTALWGIRSAVVALILFADWQLACMSVRSWSYAGIVVVSFLLIHKIKLHPIVYIGLGAVMGIVFQL